MFTAICIIYGLMTLTIFAAIFGPNVPLKKNESGFGTLMTLLNFSLVIIMPLVGGIHYPEIVTPTIMVTAMGFGIVSSIIGYFVWPKSTHTHDISRRWFISIPIAHGMLTTYYSFNIMIS